MPLHKILSLGAGVQSSTLALMAANNQVVIDGKVWTPELAIFADTQAEPPEVYEWLEYLIPLLPFPVEIVTAGNLEQASTFRHISKKSGNTYVTCKIPVFLDKGEGKRGILSRYCTRDYKIRPINKFLKQYCQINKNTVKKLYFDEIEQRNRYSVSYNSTIELALGISTDEAARMRDSQVPYQTHFYPLIEIGMSRQKCLDWMKINGYKTPPRSACYFCPYHDDAEWRNLRDNYPELFAKAVEYEKLLQSQTKGTTLKLTPYLHDSLIPLDKCTFPGDKNRMIGECEGMCGV
jgi:hypothetical protein